MHCDGEINCEDASDEDGCTGELLSVCLYRSQCSVTAKSTVKTQVTKMAVLVSYCLSVCLSVQKSMQCDGEINCEDASDEDGCTGEFMSVCLLSLSVW